MVVGRGGERLPVRAERHTAHGARVPSERLAPRLARRDVPEDDGLVVGRGGERLPVRAERHAKHGVLCARSGSPRGLPDWTSQRMTVLSADAEASVCPSGLNATLITEPVCPRSGSPRGLPDFTSQRITVLSEDAEASVCPSGLNATPVTDVRVPAERLAPRLARRRRPRG